MNRATTWLGSTVAAALVLTALFGPAAAKADKPAGGKPTASRVVLFSSDGMRPDLMQRYAAEGAMPTYAELMRDGVKGANGMVQAFPPNTGVGWYTMATGTYPSEHGSTNNTFHRTGDTFSNRTSFSGTGTLQADTIANAAERAGKRVAQIDWVAGIPAAIDGPTVDFATFYSNRAVRVGVSKPVEVDGAAAFGTVYEAGAPGPAACWAGVPTGDPAATPMEATWSIPTSVFGCNVPSPPSTCTNLNRTYNVYFYDSVTGGGATYDHAIVSPVGKTGAAPSVNLAIGDFKPIKLVGANGLAGTRAGQTVGHYVKLISLAPNLSDFKLYATSLARAAATCRTAACNALPAGGAGEDRLEKYIADNLLPWSAGDFAPLEGGVIDEDTYMEQGRDLERAYSLQVIEYILGTLQPDTDLAMVGYPFTDEVSHQFMALVTPTAPDGSPNPCYDVEPKFDDVTCTGRGTAGRVAIREGYIRSAYADADEKLAVARGLMGGSPTTFAASDHGFAPQWLAVNGRKVLFDQQISWTVPATSTTPAIPQTASLHASGGNTASNCGATNLVRAATSNAYVSGDLTKACWAGGTIQVYVNATLPAGLALNAVRSAVRDAFLALGPQVVDRVLLKEELRNVDGSDSLHPNRSGDVVVILRPPYQSDAGTPGQAIALSHFFGQHGYLPDLVDLANNINMHATFVAAGDGIRKQDDVAGIRAIDIAPTISLLMGYPGPQNARGKILYNLFPNPGRLKEVTILDISDYHGQLIPLTEAADPSLGSSSPIFAIGGSAFLKPWFDWYRAEAAGGSITVAAGDSVGATPPISGFFGDTPTIELMNLMGFSADGLGNHNFDRGQQYLRDTLIPLAQFPYLSANVVDAAGNTPPEWSPSKVFNFEGVKIGLVGFTNDDAPTLVFPGSFEPFHVANSIAAVNAEAARLKASGIDTIVAMGHLGATAGTLTAPTGPLVDLADNVTNVDAVIGDHTNQQVLTTRPNGVLLTENLSKGVRFTRIRLVVDTSTKKVVYKTADFHKPWTIGVTPDAAIQARIDALNAQLAPILGVVIGESTKAIPRADQCGPSATPQRFDGRLCESLVGNVVTDALRTAYETDFAITNSGGLRADLTCPGAGGVGAGFCPAGITPPPFPITRGGVFGVLPFGNFSVTVDITGAELKAMLERGVSAMPGSDGRFPQVSGLCFTYDISGAVGSRVTGAVQANADGSCTSTAVDLTPATTYSIATNDFTASGGDGYPNFTGRFHAEGKLLATDLADYVEASSPISPVVRAAPNGRINCTSSGATVCPTLVPSP